MLCKCSGKYINIYFKLKTTFSYSWFLLLVRMPALGVFNLAISPVRTPPWLCLLLMEGLASFIRSFVPSHLSLVSCESLYGSSSFLSLVCFGSLAFHPVVHPGWSPFGFLICATGSHSLGPWFCVCARLWYLHLPPTFFPYRFISGGPLSFSSLRRLLFLVPGVMLSVF